MTDNNIEQTPNQQDPSKAKPEDFTVYCSDYDSSAPDVSGQRDNDAEAEAKSNEQFNRGSNYTNAPKRP